MALQRIARAVIKTFFETGDFPTQDQFYQAWDSVVFWNSEVDDDENLGGASPSADKLSTQRAIKAYVDANSGSGALGARGGIIIVQDNPPDGERFYELATEVLTVPVPLISVTWTLFQNDGSTPYSTATSTSQGITVHTGVKAQVVATYRYPAPTSTQQLPTQIDGSFGTTDPGPDTDSAVFNNNGDDIEVTRTFNVRLGAAQTGLPVVGGFLRKPSGLTYSSDSITVTFRNEIFFGYLASPAITEGDLTSLFIQRFYTSNVENFNGVQPGVGNYVYYLYDSSRSAPTTILLDNATSLDFGPAGKDFLTLSDLSYTNEGGVTRTLKVLRSTNTNAFGNQRLTFNH